MIQHWMFINHVHELRLRGEGNEWQEKYMCLGYLKDWKLWRSFFEVFYQGTLWTPSKVIARLGKEINHPDSICYWAQRVSLSTFKNVDESEDGQNPIK